MKNIRSPFMVRPISTIACVLAAIVVVLGVGQSVMAFESFYSSRFAPGVSIGNIDASHRTKDEVHALLTAYNTSLAAQGIQVTLAGHAERILLGSIPLDADAPFADGAPPVAVDIEQTISKAFSVGHRENGFRSFAERITGFAQQTIVPPVITLDREQLQSDLNEMFASSLTPATEPKFAFDSDDSLAIVSGMPGRSYDLGEAATAVIHVLEQLESPAITLSMREKKPARSEQTMRALTNAAQTLIQNSPAAFIAEKRTFALAQSQKASWIIPSDDGSSVAFDRVAIRDYLVEHVESEVNVTPQAPHFTMENGRIRALSSPVTGKTLNIEETITGFIAAPSTDPVLLVIRATASPLAEEVNAIAIPEILAEAETDFKGSPTNRKKNIGVGMARINGLLVMPDEEFSLIKALGPIEVSNGFLPELVIKGNKTTPEAGGGLCQVSTTLFRAVAKAGLPVLERKNHSYRVSYYEPPVGFDATVYFPKPDFRFKNDTGNPILIFGSVHGTKAQVTIWGTRDGRTVAIDQPTVTNIKKPGAVRTIETTDLPPGKKKCTERAHNGADAVFDRRVTYANGELATDTFKSHYVVWPAVCLVGVKPPDETATSSTPQIVPEQTTTPPPSADQ